MLSESRSIDAIEKAVLAAASKWSAPWYLLDRSRKTIRVFHGDLDKSYWKRGTSRGEAQVRQVESIILHATGLRRIKRFHDYQVIEFVLREDLFDRAAVALSMSIKCLADEDAAIRRMLERRHP